MAPTQTLWPRQESAVNRRIYSFGISRVAIQASHHTRLVFEHLSRNPVPIGLLGSIALIPVFGASNIILRVIHMQTIFAPKLLSVSVLLFQWCRRSHANDICAI